MYPNEIKKNCRKIHTGLKGQINLSIIESVEGQLSDGMWENSFAMRCYWLFECCALENDEVVIYVSKSWTEIDFNKYRSNKLLDMSDVEIKTWFAKKIKQIVKQEEKDWPNSGIKWDRKCTTKLDYFHDGITVQDCYRAYDHLLARGDIYWFGKEGE